MYFLRGGGFDLFYWSKSLRDIDKTHQSSKMSYVCLKKSHLVKKLQPISIYKSKGLILLFENGGRIGKKSHQDFQKINFNLKKSSRLKKWVSTLKIPLTEKALDLHLYLSHPVKQAQYQRFDFPLTLQKIPLTLTFYS